MIEVVEFKKEDFEEIILIDENDRELDFKLNHFEYNNGVYDLKIEVTCKSKK